MPEDFGAGPTPFSYCIVGAGAIGGTIAQGLVEAGLSVSILARPGAHFEALRDNGLTVTGEAGSSTYRLPVSDRAEELAMPDVVIVCVKAQDLPATSRQLRRWVAAGTEILVIANGVPWWVPAVALELEAPLKSVDPAGVLQDGWPIDRVFSGVAYIGAAIAAPGVIERGEGARLIVGSPLKQDARALEQIAADLSAGGFDAEVSSQILVEIWSKLLGNLNLNPMSALTGATIDVMLADPLLWDLAARIHQEGLAVARGLGIELEADPQTRLNAAAELGAVRTSMLQDIERGKPLELEPIVGAVAELAVLLGVPTPSIDSVLGLLRVRTGQRPEGTLGEAAGKHKEHQENKEKEHKEHGAQD